MKNAAAYPLQLLRGQSYPHYFSVLFAPEAARAALAALYAFQHEILHISAQVKEPLPGEMRLLYWQESLKTALKAENAAAAAQAESSAAEGGQAPLIKALGAAAQTHRLPLEPLLLLCRAAAFNLYQQPMASRGAFEAYCAAIYGAILQNACTVLAGERAADAGEALSRACRYGGLAQGIAALVSDLPLCARRGKQPVPQDILQSLGIDWAQFCRAAIKPRQEESTAAAEQRLRQALAAYFRQNYALFRQAQRALPAALRPAFLPLAGLPAFMKQAEKQTASLLLAAPKISLLARQGKILRAVLLNRF